MKRLGALKLQVVVLGIFRFATKQLEPRVFGGEEVNLSKLLAHWGPVICGGVGLALTAAVLTFWLSGAAAADGCLLDTNRDGTATDAVDTIGGANAVVGTACGIDASAAGVYSTAIGGLSSASEEGSVAVGYLSSAEQIGSAAFGASSQASGTHSTALGWNSNASGTDSVALGYFSMATNTSTVAAGNFAVATGDQGSAFGDGSGATGSASTAIGALSVASGQASTTVGAFTSATGESSSAFGFWANASALGGVAVGANSVASASEATALGFNTEAKGERSTALGGGAAAAHAGSMALGHGVKTTRDGQVAVGHAANTYTFAGITSSASLAAQSGPLQVVTTDANGNLASDGGVLFEALANLGEGVGKANEGVALALAMDAPYVPPDQTFALSAAFGTYEGSDALAFSGAWRPDGGSYQIDMGFGYGMSSKSTGGRVGVTFGW